MKVDRSTPKHERWLAYAEEDLEVSKAVINLPHMSVIPVLFHAHQCAEKTLKAYLIYHNIKFRRSHDLIELVNTCAKINDEFFDLTQLAVELNPFAEVRYPEKYYPDPYEPIGEGAITFAKHILTFTKDAIDILVHKKKPRKRPRATV